MNAMEQATQRTNDRAGRDRAGRENARQRAWLRRGSGSLRMVALALAAAAAPAFAQSEPAKVDVAKGQEIASQVCVACHAIDGNSPTPANPILASQHPEYLFKQLSDYKVKEGAQQAARANAIMAGFAAGLSEADMRNVAAYLSRQPMKPAVATNQDIVEAGQRIYRMGIPEKKVPACAGCHSPTGAGIPAQYPRLGGQYAEYTDAQLVAFRQGTRTNNPEMTAIAARLSDAEIKAVSEYIAGLR